METAKAERLENENFGHLTSATTLWVDENRPNTPSHSSSPVLGFFAHVSEFRRDRKTGGRV